jgi:hypothetical protein
MQNTEKTNHLGICLKKEGEDKKLVGTVFNWVCKGNVRQQVE